MSKEVAVRETTLHFNTILALSSNDLKPHGGEGGLPLAVRGDLLASLAVVFLNSIGFI